MRSRPLLIAVAIASSVVVLRPQERAREPEQEREGKFSPLGFYDLHAYEQAYPADPGDPAVIRASATKYWAFRGVAYRGNTAAGSVWTTLGPETSVTDDTERVNISGRVSALAVSPTCELEGPCRVWVGAAGGGVWRTDDAMNTADVGWRWIGQGLGTNNIGSLALDPNDHSGNTIFVGTGETNSANNSGAGTGLYRSVDGGDHWTRITTMILDPVVSSQPIDFTFTRGISTVVVEPGNPNVIYAATTTAMLGMTAVRGGQSQKTGFPQPRPALYKTENGGTSWTLLWLPPLEPVIPPNPNLGSGAGDTMIGVRHVKLDPRNSKIIYASAFNNAIHRSAPSLENGDASFKPVYGIVGFQRFQDLAMFDLTVKDGRTRMYVYNGTASVPDQGFYRLDNADVPASALVNAGTLANTSVWLKLSSDDSTQPGITSRRICTAQCFYDLVVAVPEGEPDTVLVGGVATAAFGEPTIRSTNAGVGFSAFGSDAQDPRNRAHVDVRAIIFHPKNSKIVWVGSDGGVVRSDGGVSNITSRCASLTGNAPQCAVALAEVPTRLYFLNRGLQTLQFYNIALDPRNPLGRMLGGLQDNSTIWLDGTGTGRTWKTVFGSGDGTSASGFHPTRSNVIFASFQSNRFFTNFQNGVAAGWMRTDDPIRASSERETITATTGRQFITFDVVNPDTQFTAFQHVWRTKTNGGVEGREATCRSNLGGSTGCGDWVPLGVAYPFVTGSTPESASRKPGDLISDFYGADRAGGLIVSAERTPATAGTLWAATNFGRIFVSPNADAPNAEVRFIRIDTPGMPNRFVTRIVPSRTNPNIALIWYSGFNTLTPSTPGHVFRATFSPTTETATFESLDFDLTDFPINTLAWDDLRGDIYAATDFGPLVLRNGTQSWALAGVGFPEALMVDLEIVPEQRLLVAATHGLGIFYTTLPAVGSAGLRTAETRQR